MTTKALRDQKKANKIRMLLKKKETLFRDILDLADFKEPVVFLMRNNRKVEFYENATKNDFEFDKGDEEVGIIKLNPQYLHTFNYGKRTFRGYICHEDYPMPLPENPIMTAEMFSNTIDKTLMDIKSWKAKELEAKVSLRWALWGGIGLILLILAIFGKDLISFVTGIFGIGGAETVVNSVNTTIQNVPVVLP